MHIDILFQDDHILAVHKPAGIPVHPNPLTGPGPDALRLAREASGRWVYPVHRLDAATSGVLLFGLSREAARELAFLFRDRKVQKRYLAVARGWFPGDVDLCYPLREEAGKEPVEATTLFRLLGRAELPESVGRHPSARFSLVEAIPRTGRMHQIRKHLHHLSHHLIGDTTYGDGTWNRFFRQRFSLHRMMLFSIEMSLPNPFGKEPLLFRAPLPAGVLPAFFELGWEEHAH